MMISQHTNADWANTLPIPSPMRLIHQDTQRRNSENVTIARYQDTERIVPNHSHTTIISGGDGRLISYNRVTPLPIAALPNDQTARAIAVATWQAIAPHYAQGLTFMRIDHQTRTFIDDQGHEHTFPVAWVKFAHTNGTYNWVTIGPGGVVVEYERESEWDYTHNRRATEQWNYDDWVLARMGEGPQLAAPNARA